MPLFPKRSRNRSSSFGELTYVQKSCYSQSLKKNLNSKSGNIFPQTKDVNVSESGYSALSRKVDELVKFNQETKGEKSNIIKFELTSEFKGSQIEKISEKFLTEDEEEKDGHEGMDTEEDTTNTPSRIQHDSNILQIPER